MSENQQPTTAPPQNDEERFDVVDASDIVVGTAPRSEVHRRKLRHRAIHVFVFNTAGEIFLQRRSLRKDTAPGRWVSSCSGHVDAGEDYDTAARRELAEEIGLTDPLELRALFKEEARKETGHEFVWVYSCRAEGPFTLDADEIMDGQWISSARLDAWMAECPRDFAWSFAHLWKMFQRHAAREAAPAS